MRKVYTIGETVLDILFSNNQPFTAKAGGACLNCAVTLGRLNLPTYFIGEYGLDEVGNFVDNFLKNNNVSTDFVYRYYDGKSTLALAFLNENCDASYDFYKIYPEKRLNINFPEIQQDDIIIFGSIYAITPEVREKLIEFIKQANKKKAIVIYDPNFRKQHLHDLPKLKPMIIENMALANIIRGSHEDFSFIFGVKNADEAFDMIKDKVSNLLYTTAHKGVFLRTLKTSGQYKTREIEAKSTIGAGDSFNAGVAYSLYKNEITFKKLNNLEEAEWAKIINTAIEFATHVCMSYDNYISKDFAKSYELK
ncbi:MAG: carbohydrate kinase [Bacteroidales bacterium]|nr:MAG: carbohydrate kinase [Bacteroidales bacterium]